MAYHTPKDLDSFIPHLGKADTKLRLQAGADLLKFLAEPSNSTVCQDIGIVVDALIPWMQSSNFKVSSNGIEVMTYLIDRLGSDFRPYLQTVLPNVIDRLGDSKDSVREKAQLLLLKLLERNALTPQHLFERLAPGFTHKNAKIREEVLRCLLNTLNVHGPHSLTLNRFIPDIVKLLSDPTATVRDTASNTMVDLYKHVGEKLRMDLQRRNLVPQGKWPALCARFDEVKEGGELFETADEPDRVAVVQKPVIAAKKPNLGGGAKARSANVVPSATTVLSRIGSMRKLAAAPGHAGALDEDSFTKAFEDVPIVRIFSAREVTDNLKSILDIISDSTKDWNKRVEALKRIRSLIIAGATDYDEFYVGIKQLEFPLQAIIKDLRSQVVREGCISVSYLAQTLGNKFERTAEIVLAPLINLIQNSVKIMSTSGLVAVKFIIRYIQYARLIPIITSNCLSSKSKEIRRSCCDFLDFILNNWPSHALEKHLGILQESVKKGVADADPEARVSSRKAFRGFRELFPDQAECLLQSLEPSYRRILQGDGGMSASSSNSNLPSAFKTPRGYGKTMTSPQSSTDSGRKGFRSNSAIDLQAAQRAKARAQYSAMARNKIASGTASLPRPRKAVETIVVQSPERLARTRSRNSQSQPTSRSGSPSSRLAYLYTKNTEHDSPRPRRLSSGIPRSTTGSREASRETSPNRSMGRFRSRAERPPISPASRPVLAQKILQQSREAENALADAFQNDAGDQYRSPRKTIRSIDNHSDESETSSVCSERSFDSFRRPSDDIQEIIALCASNVWQERKDGLLSLHYYLSNETPLSPDEIAHLTDVFTKMFMDSHTKGLSLFLDTLHELIRMHKDDLHAWIYVLLQRVFLKIGTETLNSVQSKLLATIEIIKVSFPPQLLTTNVYRFLVDPTQTPTSKVKIIVLNFVTALCGGGELVMGPPANQALQKIIVFSQDVKSMELRNAAKNCLVAMWNANTPQVTMLLGDLPKDYQDIARSIVHSHMRKSSTGSEPGSPLVAASPRTMSPGTPPPHRGDGLDQEEIYRSLRKTTAEIQNYSFETKLDRETTSQDSGISQMSQNDVAVLEEKMEELNFRRAPRSLPVYSSVNGSTENDSNGYRSLGDLHHSDVIKDIFVKCMVDHPTTLADKRELLGQLRDMIRQGCTDFIIENFKQLLKILIDNLKEQDSQTRYIVLEILTAIFQRKEMKACWLDFLELLTLRVLQAHCDEKPEVAKMAETTAAAMSVCPFNTIVKTLAPLIHTSTYPQVLGVIKMLTKLVEAVSEEITDDHLAMIMPGLIKGVDHVESPVRKSSIFCLVALHKTVEEERLAPYVTALSGSRMKLLKVYIGRAQQKIPSVASPK